MTEFTNYTNILLSALQNNPKNQDVVAKKKEILEQIYEFHNIAPRSTLFVGFNPAMLSVAGSVYVTAISSEVQKYLDEQNLSYTYIDPTTLSKYSKKFDSVVAFDEFFTFANTDVEQQQMIRMICDCARQVVISTVRDYKNQDFKDREFSNPGLIRNNSDNRMYFEFHDWNIRDRNSWNTTVYEIEHPKNKMSAFGPFTRRTMFFKQLAKFSMDAGATHFQVHKNLMYKSLIKKNYEHVVSIIFE